VRKGAIASVIALILAAGPDCASLTIRNFRSTAANRYEHPHYYFSGFSFPLDRAPKIVANRVLTTHRLLKHEGVRLLKLSRAPEHRQTATSVGTPQSDNVNAGEASVPLLELTQCLPISFPNSIEQCLGAVRRTLRYRG
jgi:hypothetical protein